MHLERTWMPVTYHCSLQQKTVRVRPTRATEPLLTTCTCDRVHSTVTSSVGGTSPSVLVARNGRLGRMLMYRERLADGDQPAETQTQSHPSEREAVEVLKRSCAKNEVTGQYTERRMTVLPDIP